MENQGHLLRNVLAAVGDYKELTTIEIAVGGQPVDTNVYFPAVLSLTDYYPFGMEMPDRVLTSEGYRYGFNGQEHDDEWNKHYEINAYEDRPESISDVPKQKTDGLIEFQESIGIEGGSPGYQGEISEAELNFWQQVKIYANLVGDICPGLEGSIDLSYGIADDIWIVGQSFSSVGSDARHLDRTLASATERQQAFGNTASLLLTGAGSGSTAKGSTNLLTQFSKSTIDDAVSLTMEQKATHIYANKLHPKPWLNDLATQMGGQRNVTSAALQNANGRITANASGIFNTPVNVGGVKFTIRGFVYQGRPFINSIFKP